MNKPKQKNVKIRSRELFQEVKDYLEGMAGTSIPDSSVLDAALGALNRERLKKQTDISHIAVKHLVEGESFSIRLEDSRLILQIGESEDMIFDLPKGETE